MTFDSMRVALRGVLANRMRSALTMLGILIGTAAVILLVGVGQGISDEVQDQNPQAMAQVTSILRRTHRIGPNTPPDFVVFNAASLLAAGKAAAKQFQLLLGVVAGISLLIGGIGVMNICW